MTNEISVTAQLQVTKGSLQYQSLPAAFNDDMAGAIGPAPGTILATVEGVDVDLSIFTTPGWLQMQSLDTDTNNFVEFGIYDATTSVFFPLGELGPGLPATFKLSRNLFDEFGTGTGTIGAADNTFRLKAWAASAYVQVDCFEA